MEEKRPLLRASGDAATRGRSVRFRSAAPQLPALRARRVRVLPSAAKSSVLLRVLCETVSVLLRLLPVCLLSAALWRCVWVLCVCAPLPPRFVCVCWTMTSRCRVALCCAPLIRSMRRNLLALGRVAVAQVKFANVPPQIIDDADGDAVARGAVGDAAAAADGAATGATAAAPAATGVGWGPIAIMLLQNFLSSLSFSMVLPSLWPLLKAVRRRAQCDGAAAPTPPFRSALTTTSPHNECDVDWQRKQPVVSGTPHATYRCVPRSVCTDSIRRFCVVRCDISSHQHCRFCCRNHHALSLRHHHHSPPPPPLSATHCVRAVCGRVFFRRRAGRWP